MIVVDSTVVPYLFVEGELTEMVREMHRMDPGWVTPPILNHEMLHVLARLGVTEGGEVVGRLWREIRAVLGVNQQVPDPARSLRLAVRHRIGGNEAQYLCLAEVLDLPLISEDLVLRERFRGRVFGVEEYLGLKF
jgi:predicted nucleic acid-binding protein